MVRGTAGSGNPTHGTVDAASHLMTTTSLISLMRTDFAAWLAGPSLPLDIGYAETVPAGIRNAVLLRDKHCQCRRLRPARLGV